MFSRLITYPLFKLIDKFKLKNITLTNNAKYRVQFNNNHDGLL